MSGRQKGSGSIHVAQFSDELIDPLAAALRHFARPRVTRDLPILLDPFAGLGVKLGKIAALVPAIPMGFEIEAAYVKRAEPFVHKADSRNLRHLGHETIDMAVTSPVYPNGMADNFHARDESTRNTYVHRIREFEGDDYELAPGNAAATNPRRSPAALARFYEINEAVFKEVWRCLIVGAPFVVNVKDPEGVPDFTRDTTMQLRRNGFRIASFAKIKCRGNNYGANQQGTKSDTENIIVALKEAA